MNIFKKNIKYITIIASFLLQNISADIIRDLEIDKIFTTIDTTKTSYGKKQLHTILTHPTNNIEILTQRQTLIQECANNSQLSDALQRELSTFNTYEPALHKLFQPTDSVKDAALEQFYFASSFCKKFNTHPALLECGLIGHLANLMGSTIQHTLTLIILTKYLDDHTCHAGCSHEHGIIESFTKNIKQIFNNKKPKKKRIKSAVQTWHVLAQIQELYAVQSIIRNELSVIRHLQEQLVALANGIHSIKNIHTLLQNAPHITNNLSLYSHIHNLCTKSNISDKLQQLLTLLEKPTFKSASFFSRIGNILAAYKLVNDINKELIPAFHAMGEIDAYVSCAQLLDNNNDTTMQYTYAQYQKPQNGPSIDAHDFWHPLATNTPQPNTLILSNENNTRNIIITGPNACGKSTTLKNLTLCAYLAQTITLVPAKHYSQTIFKEIYSSINITDDIQNNASLFVTELHNAEELLNTIEMLQPNEYIFIALDELFTSTHHTKGQTVAYNLLKNIYTSPQVVSVVTTHFEELTKLSQDNRYCCTNYTVKNFTVMPGIGKPDISFDIIKKEHISRLLE